MLYYTPPDKFDEDIPKSDFEEVRRIRRRQSAAGAVILIAALAAAAWLVLKVFPRSCSPAAGSTEEPTEQRSIDERFPAADPDGE
jgi:hypothetical protein